MTTQPRETATRNKRWDKPRYVPKRKVCFFCKEKVEHIDYKNLEQIRPFVSDRAKIDPARKTGTCARHQRVLALAIKRARHLALLPFVPAHIRRTGGVSLR